MPYSMFSMKDINCLELMRLATNPEFIEQMIVTNRQTENRPLDAPEYPDETIFRTFLKLWSDTIEQILEEAAPSELFDVWVKHAKWPRRKGRPHEISLFYDLAATHKLRSGKTAMQVYREMFLPILIGAGWLPLDKSGDPDPILEQVALKNFLNAMNERKQKHSG